MTHYPERSPPEPGRALRQALRGLASEKGDLRQLEAPLQRYHRLRVGAYRVIFAYGEKRAIECVFAERRSLVYEIFAREVASRLLASPEQ